MNDDLTLNVKLCAINIKTNKEIKVDYDNITMQSLASKLRHYFDRDELRKLQTENSAQKEELLCLREGLDLLKKDVDFWKERAQQYCRLYDNQKETTKNESAFNAKNKRLVADFIIRRVKRYAKAGMSKKEFVSILTKQFELYVTRYTLN